MERLLRRKADNRAGYDMGKANVTGITQQVRLLGVLRVRSPGTGQFSGFLKDKKYLIHY